MFLNLMPLIISHNVLPSRFCEQSWIWSFLQQQMLFLLQCSHYVGLLSIYYQSKSQFQQNHCTVIVVRWAYSCHWHVQFVCRHVNLSRFLKCTFTLLFYSRLQHFRFGGTFLHFMFLFLFKNANIFILTLCSIALQGLCLPSYPLLSFHPGLPGYGYPGITSPLPPAPALRNA